MNKAAISFVCFFFILSASLQAVGQNIPMIRYTTEDGLPSNCVYTVYKDSNGFLWVGSDKGIARYNGIKFEIFTTWNGLPDNIIFLFKEDNYGRIWLATYNGEFCYYKDGLFHTAKNTPFLNFKYDAAHIKTISSEPDSSLIFTFNTPDIVVDIHHETPVIIDLRKVKNRKLRDSVVITKKIGTNKYKIICSDKIVVIDSNYNVIEEQPLARQFINRGRRFTSCQNQDYMFNDSVFFNYDMQVVNKFPKNFHKLYFLHQIYLDGGNTYYTTNNGLFINDTLRFFEKYDVSNVIKDRNGDYWVATVNGLYVISGKFRNAKEYNSAYEGKARFAYSDGKRLFFATADNSLYCLENGKIKCTFHYKSYKHDDYQFALEPVYLIDSQHRYYSLYNEDVVVIDDLLSEKKNVHIRPANKEFPKGLKSICISGKKMLIRRRTQLISLPYPDLDSISNFRYSVVADANDRILEMGVDSGGGTWFSLPKEMRKVENGREVKLPQFNDNVLRAFIFSGNYLVGYTGDNRLVICSNYNSRNVSFTPVTQENCIWDKLYQLDQSHILISTNNVYRILTLYPGDSSKPYSVNTIDDPFIPTQADAVCADSLNCYFFKNGTILSVAIQKLYARPVSPGLFFTFLRTNKGIYPISNTLQVSYSESKNMGVSFSVLSFGDKDVSCQYSFSKNGPENWNDVNGEEINLVQPGYGMHIVKVRAKTTSGDYCEPITFMLDISEPFWVSWWFIILSACFSIALLSVWIRYRIKSALLKKEKVHKNEIKFMKSEYKALNALMNPHFIFNTLNNVQSLINKNEKNLANEYLRTFANLVRQNMHNISQELISLQKEIDVVINYLKLEKLRFKEFLNYEINIDGQMDLSEIMVPPLLIQPIVENSIKHGILPRKSVDSLISIAIYECDGFLVIVIKDNGIGIEAARKRSDKLHESSSLANIRKRIAQLALIQNKEIKLDITSTGNDDNGQWTIVTISISIA